MIREPVRLALYQPDIAQNTGTLARLGACLGIPIDLIEPAGFDISDRNFKRAGMDYADRATIQRHISFEKFNEWRIEQGYRLILGETDGTTRYTDFAFQKGDILLMGRESAGVPQSVYAACEASVHIPQMPDTRSLNVALAAAIMVGEALRQAGQKVAAHDKQEAIDGR
jgi:tRNA (cytidine/uridine-2'-O-)-methyltransferase